MKQVAIIRMLNRLGALGMITLLAVLAVGCADNSTGPAPTDQNPPGTNASVVISDPVTQGEADSVRANSQRNSSDTIVITIDEAIVRALTQVNGELLGVNLDYDRDELNYECVVRQNGRVYLVVVDPKTGNVEKKEELSDTAYYYPTIILIRTVKVKVKDAEKKAKELSDGDVVECNMENIDGQPTYIIVVLTHDNRYVTVFVDADTGKEKKVSDDGNCTDDEHKNKKGRGHYRHGRGHGYGHRHHCHCDCENGGGNGGGGDTTQVRDSVITKDSATTIVHGMFAGDSTDSITITESKLERKNDSVAFYNFKIEKDSNKYELVLDAYTGAFVSVKQTAGNLDSVEFKPMAKDSLVTLSVARTAAIAQLAGTVQSWTLEYDATEAKWVYTFEIKPVSGANKKVVVDAKTGMFIRIK